MLVFFYTLETGELTCPFLGWNLGSLVGSQHLSALKKAHSVEGERHEVRVVVDWAITEMCSLKGVPLQALPTLHGRHLLTAVTERRTDIAEGNKNKIWKSNGTILKMPGEVMVVLYC